MSLHYLAVLASQAFFRAERHQQDKRNKEHKQHKQRLKNDPEYRNEWVKKERERVLEEREREIKEYEQKVGTRKKTGPFFLGFTIIAVILCTLILVLFLIVPERF